MSELAAVHGSFEHDGAWTLSGEALIDDGTFLGETARTGSRYLYLYAYRDDGFPINLRSDAEIVFRGLPSGKLVTPLVYAKGTRTGPVSCSLQIATSDTDPLSSYGSIAIGVGTYTASTFTPIQLETDYLRIALSLTASNGGEASVFLDDFSLQGGHYPFEYGPFHYGETWHVDDIMGLMIPRSAAWRDEDGRLIDWRDADEEGRDEWRYRHPGEQHHEEP